MPNHILNTLVVKCDDSRYIAKVRELLIQEVNNNECGNFFDFNNIIPKPKYVYAGDINFNDTMAKEFSWFDWCVDNWDTKWNSYDGNVITDEEHEIAICFNTAWSPPMAVIDKLFEVFHKTSGLLFYVSEFYNDLQGVVIYEGGRVVEEHGNLDSDWLEYANKKIEECDPYITPIID